MPHDIMQNLYAGIVPHEMKLLVNYCVSKEYFDLNTLNSHLNAFDFGYTETGDKPHPLKISARSITNMAVSQSSATFSW